MPATLLFQFPGGCRREMAFHAPEVLVVGRSHDCAIVIPEDWDPSVSRHHCIFEISPPSVLVEDIGSANGTFHNGRRLVPEAPPVAFSPGDCVTIGRTLVHVRIDPDKAAPPPLAEHADGPEQSPQTIPPHHTPLGPCALDAQDADLSGAVVGGYRLEAKIGSGSVGTVYRALSTAGTPAAVKILNSMAASAPGVAARFKAEARLAASHRHPNIVRVLDSGESGGLSFMAMEFCSGGSLAMRLRAAGGRLPLDQALRLAQDILRGLERLHHGAIPGGGAVHRDIKPENILLSSPATDAHAKVADLGVAYVRAAAAARLTRTGAVAGTPEFACRLQILDYKHAGPEVDVWSAAAVLYRMLAGRPPRPLQPGVNPFRAALEASPIPVRVHAADIPAPLAELLDAALADDGPLAFRSAAEFSAALSQAARLCGFASQSRRHPA